MTSKAGGCSWKYVFSNFTNDYSFSLKKKRSEFEKEIQTIFIRDEEKGESREKHM